MGWRKIPFCRADSLKKVCNGKGKCSVIQTLKPTFSANPDLDSARRHWFWNGHATKWDCVQGLHFSDQVFLVCFFWKDLKVSNKSFKLSLDFQLWHWLPSAKQCFRSNSAFAQNHPPYLFSFQTMRSAFQFPHYCRILLIHLPMINTLCFYVRAFFPLE